MRRMTQPWIDWKKPRATLRRSELACRSGTENKECCSWTEADAPDQCASCREGSKPGSPLVETQCCSFSCPAHDLPKYVFLTPNVGAQPRPVRSEATSRTSAAATGYTYDVKLASGSCRNTPLFSVFDAARWPRRKRQGRVRATRERQRADFSGTAVGARSLSETADSSALFLCFSAPAFIEVRITLELSRGRRGAKRRTGRRLQRLVMRQLISLYFRRFLAQHAPTSSCLCKPGIVHQNSDCAGTGHSQPDATL